MLAPLKWINEYTNIPFSTDEEIKTLCDRLDLTGTGVEGIEKMGSQFDHVVTGVVLKKEKHPDSDHMWVCKVGVGDKNVGADGEPEPLQIVCGAQNFNEGDHIVVAMIGAVLPGDFKIKKSKLRGVASCGMNCSARELGLSNDHEGIMILPEDAPVGMPLAQYLDKNEVVLDLEITPNRPDCLSVRGLAREFAAMNGRDWTDPIADDFAKLIVSKTETTVEDEVDVTVEDSTRCPRYTAAVIKGVKVGPSPQWLVDKLLSVGQRSVNNIVDVTNYILFLYGQPMHAFDLDWLKNGEDKAHIIVRAAKEGEKLTTLDGQERALTEDMTLITTESAGPVGLAGVMGGLNSEITENTKNVCIEVATFEPGSTSRTSRNLKLFSESSMRYEREVDDHDIDVRSAIAAALIQEVAGGEVLCNRQGDFGLVDVWSKKSEPETLAFRCNRFRDFVGDDVPNEFIAEVLKRLGCVVDGEGDELSVVRPTFRPDLTREIDLYEEVLRIWGEDRIPSTLPKSAKRVGHLTDFDIVRRKVDNTLRANGMNETLSYSFNSLEEIDCFQPTSFKESVSVELLNPLNSEQAHLRQSILPGLMESVRFNSNHGTKRVALYEIGTVFSTTAERKLPKERTRVAGVLCGNAKDKSWDGEARKFDFFDAKGVLEDVADVLNLPKVKFKVGDPEEYSFLLPGRIAVMFSGGTQIGWVGEIHPQVSSKYDTDDAVCAFELDFAALEKTAMPAKPYVDLSEFPAIEMDQNFVVDESVTCERMQQVITSAGGKLLTGVSLVDIYRNPITVGAGKKSMSFKLIYQSTEKTLESSEVEKLHNKVVTKVAGATGATMRG